MFLDTRIFVNSLVFIKGFHIKWEQNYFEKLYSMITQILMPWFKKFDSNKNIESAERQKTSFPKEIVEKTGLHKAVLNKTMATQILCEVSVLRSLLSKVAETPSLCFPVNIAKFLRTPILKNILNGCFFYPLSSILKHSLRNH